MKLISHVEVQFCFYQQPSIFIHSNAKLIVENYRSYERSLY